MSPETETTVGERRLLLYFTQKNPPLGRLRIAKEVGLHPVTVSKAICSLERRGLLCVERTRQHRQGRHSYSKVSVTTA